MLEKQEKTSDFHFLFFQVNNLVSRGQTRKSGKVQISNASFNTLRHKVYFFPGLPEQHVGSSQQEVGGGDMGDLLPSF
jgi:hypothetical protein